MKYLDLKITASLIIAVVVLGIIYISFIHKKVNIEKPISFNITPNIVSTDPNPLDNAVIFSKESFSITFNLPIQNVGELKHTITPKMDYSLKLSDDRKTAIFTPNKPLPIGKEYTLQITGDTKMDGPSGMILLDQTLIYHIRTIPYNGV